MKITAVPPIVMDMKSGKMRFNCTIPHTIFVLHVIVHCHNKKVAVTGTVAKIYVALVAR